MRVLIVDDHQDAVANMADYLTLMGYDVDVAYQGKAALSLLTSFSFDAIVLDVMMPVQDGLTTCRQIRQSEHADTPIIFVTARDTLEDKLDGFRAGADDYLVKPFELAELGARLEAVLARASRRMAPELAYGQLRLCLNTNQAYYREKPLSLDPTQREILKLLLRKAPAVVSQSDIAYHVWQDELIESSALRTQIYRLRRALPAGTLQTVRGCGYRLDAAAE